MQGHSQTRKKMGAFACICLVASLLFAAFGFIGGASVNAQGLAQVDIGGPYLVDEVDGTFDVRVTLTPGADDVASFQVDITYDPTLVMPILVTDPAQGTVDTPTCVPLTANALVVCGPSNPTDTATVGMFRIVGGFTSASEIADVQFKALGSEGVSDLIVTVTGVRNSLTHVVGFEERKVARPGEEVSP